jgi:hypothetical protein
VAWEPPRLDSHTLVFSAPSQLSSQPNHRKSSQRPPLLKVLNTHQKKKITSDVGLNNATTSVVQVQDKNFPGFLTEL